MSVQQHALRFGVVRIERDRATGLAHRLGARGIAGLRGRARSQRVGVLGGELLAAFEVAIAVEIALDRVGELARGARTSLAMSAAVARAHELVELRRDLGDRDGACRAIRRRSRA